MANEYQGYSPSDWAGIAATTLPKHIREVEDAWMRNHRFLGLIQSRGRVSYNNGGRGFDWPVRYMTGEVEGYTGTNPRNFAAKNRHMVANLHYRGYIASAFVNDHDLEANKGEEAIVKVYDNMVSHLEDDMNEALATQPFIDGNATGNTQFWHGIESFFGTNGTINISTGAQRSANAADKCGYPSDTYAGISTILGTYGGANQSGMIWPLGIADSQYDFWTPLIVNYTSTAFSPATHTWATQGDEAMRFAILNAQRNKSDQGGVSHIFLERTLYGDMLNLMDNKEQINITTANELRALGFNNTFVYDGVEVTWDVAVPAGVGYGLNFNCIELMCMQGSLLNVEGPVWDIDAGGSKALVKTLSNLKFKSPRNFFKLVALA